MRNLIIAFVLIALIAGGGIGYLVYQRQQSAKMAGTPQTSDTPQSGAPSNAPSGQVERPTVTIMGLGLLPQNDSQMYGGVELKAEGEQTRVTITVNGDYEKGGTHPAHIHTGVCPTPGEVKYNLTPATNGTSVTVLDTNLTQLAYDLPLVINVHKSAEEQGTYLACGDFPSPE